MRQRVLIYTSILIFIAILLFFIRINNSENISGLSIESLPPEQDLEGYGEDFTLSIENVNLIDSKLELDYKLNSFIENAQSVIVNIELYDESGLINSKSLELIISGNKYNAYSNSFSLIGDKKPSKLVIAASGSSSYRRATLLIAENGVLITGNVISDRQKEVSVYFIIFFFILMVLFFIAKRKHLKNKSKHFASKHEDNLISVHH